MGTGGTLRCSRGDTCGHLQLSSQIEFIVLSAPSLSRIFLGGKRRASYWCFSRFFLFLLMSDLPRAPAPLALTLTLTLTLFIAPTFVWPLTP